MQLTFLGTGAMVPTKQRNVSSVLLDFEGEFILFDCGEGTQRQMNLAGLNRTKVKKVLITHWHGDHVSGLIGLIQTIGNIPNPGTLDIYGPEGTEERMFHLTNSAYFDKRLTLNIHEVCKNEKIETIHENKKYSLEAATVEHTVPTVAFSFIEKDRRRIDVKKAESFGITPGPLMGKLQKGKDVKVDGKTVSPDEVTYIVKGRKISYVMDTAPCTGAERIAQDASVLICESTFGADEQEKAVEYGHLSAKDAAIIARDANAKQLVITHFSQRYVSTDSLLEEAQSVFKNTLAANDFMQLDVEN